jgi:uncharacterized damage-inducible protein DinB
VTKEDVRLLYEYDRWANDRILKLVGALTPEQFTRDLGGSFPSVRKEHVEFLNEVTDELLDRTLPVRSTSVSLAHLMQHLANHSTYHRGQIAMMLRQLGAKAQGTDFAEFLLTAADSYSHLAGQHSTAHPAELACARIRLRAFTR